MTARLTLAIVAIAISCSAAGCFPFHVTLVEPEPALIDEALLGEWTQLNMPTGVPPGRARIGRFNDHEYSIDASWTDEDGKYGKLSMRGFLIDVDGTTFLSISKAHPRTGRLGYSFVRVDAAPNGDITLAMVADRWAKVVGSTSESLRAFLVAKRTSEDLYDKGVVRIRRVGA